MKKIALLILVALTAVSLALPGCNDVNGLFNKLFGGGQPPPGPVGPVGPTGPTMPGAPPITESGYLSGPNASYKFTVNAGDVTYVEVPFTYPKGSVDFWVKVVGQDGYTVLGDFDLDNGEIIQLMGGGTFYLTIYSKSGSGNWSATYSLTAEGAPYPGDEGIPYPGGGGTPYPGGGTNGNCTTVGNSASGNLTGPGDSCSFIVSSSNSSIDVPFTYPKGSVDFWVEVVGSDGYTLISDVDLDNLDKSTVKLTGSSGPFYLTIYSRDGAGDWSCSWQ